MNEPPTIDLRAVRGQLQGVDRCVGGGAQLSSAPLVALNAASRVRATPFALLNTPPA